MNKRIRHYLSEPWVAQNIARLFSGAVTRDEARQMVKQRAGSVTRREHFSEMAQVMAELDVLADDPDLMSIVVGYEHKRIGENRLPGYRRHDWPKWVMAAASLLVAVAIGFVAVDWTAKENDAHMLRYLTRIGEQKIVNLEDGSEVTLNTGTELIVDISDTFRQVLLRRGEAYFNVAPDSLRPFSVEVGESAVTALGTAFNVRKLPGKFTVAVVEGSVSLHQREETASRAAPTFAVEEGKVVRLKSGEQRRIEAGTVVEVDPGRQELSVYKERNTDRLSGWRTGVLRFDAEPLHKVVMELNRYSPKKILIEDVSLMEMKIYAAVKLDNIPVALSVLEHTLPVKVIYQFDQILIVKK